MKSYLVDVRLNGSLEHVVTGKRATVPEIALLRMIHGTDAVSNVRSGEDVADYSEEEERLRLASTYDTRNQEDGQSRMERLFGVQARLPATLKDIGIDAKAAAKEAQAAAEAAAARAAEMQADADADDAAGDEAEADEAKLFD